MQPRWRSTCRSWRRQWCSAPPLIRPSGTFSQREKDLDEGPSLPPRPLSLRERVAEGRVRGLHPTHDMTIKRRRAIGAEIVDGGVHFRVWAPAWDSVAVVIGGDATPLESERDGYFAKLIAHARAGTRYRFRLGDGDYPD